jgi:hypothetical protein
MADHARLILHRERREFLLLPVAGAALLMPWFGRIKLHPFLDRSLIVRVVAAEAPLVIFDILHLLGAVFSLLEIARDLFVADQAVIRLKTIPGSFSYFFRVGMKAPFLNFLMAILARSLSMNRSVKFLGIDPPGGMGRSRAPP